MTNHRPLVSVVCPAFQEEQVLPIFHAVLSQELRMLEHAFRFEIVYVDDGSADGTLDALRVLAQTDARVSFLALSRNFGHQAALTAGLEHARGDAIISLDADLQHPPRLVRDLLEQWQRGHDVVITLRNDDERLSWFKRLSSRSFYWLMQSISETEIRIAASDFRLLSRKALRALLQLKEQHRFVRGMVQWLGFRVKEIRFDPDERRAGVSKYTLRRMMRLALDGLFSFSRVPLRLAFAMAALFATISAAHGLGGAVRWIQDSDQAGWHYLLTSIHGGVAALLLAVGILGEYLGRVHDQAKSRPLYLLSECQMQPVEGDADQTRRAAA